MSVIPVQLDLVNRTIKIQHENHTAEISFDDVTFPKVQDMELTTSICMSCPVCGATTTHPVSGGAAPVMVQQLFIRKLKERHQGRTFSQAKILTRELVIGQAGIQRWYNDDLEES